MRKPWRASPRTRRRCASDRTPEASFAFCTKPTSSGIASLTRMGRMRALWRLRTPGGPSPPISNGETVGARRSTATSLSSSRHATTAGTHTRSPSRRALHTPGTSTSSGTSSPGCQRGRPATMWAASHGRPPDPTGTPSQLFLHRPGRWGRRVLEPARYPHPTPPAALVIRGRSGSQGHGGGPGTRSRM